MVYKNIRKGKLKQSAYQRTHIASMKAAARAAALAVANQAGKQVVKAVKRKAVQQVSGYLKGRRLTAASTSTVKRQRKFYKVKGQSGGTTYTTTRMIIRKTPRKQRFLRKLFKTNPLKTKYVNRFGFSWMGASAASKTIWYSVCHLKFNNVSKYLQDRLIQPTQPMNQTSAQAMSIINVGNSPESYVYIGKCTFNYELYNPTNYIMTVYIYDLICKRDTPYSIMYNDVNNDDNSAPENCMQHGAETVVQQNTGALNGAWTVADPTYESGTNFNTIGMKPTDYHYLHHYT